jgi:hypothetical protein
MIPDSQSIMLPYLKLISDRREWHFQDIVEALASHFKLHHDERLQMIPSGQKVFDYRVGFSRTVFIRVGLVESTRHGFVRITQTGISFLANPKMLKNLIMKPTRNNNDSLGNHMNPPNFKFEDITYFKALGNLLTYYYSDLIYINNFQLFKKGSIDLDFYSIATPGTFKAFLNEYGIARSIIKGSTSSLLKLTNEWIKTENPYDVDGFAVFLKKRDLTKGKIVTSLASKVLFLNDPLHILPMDTRTRETVGLKENCYEDYNNLVNEFKKQNEYQIIEILKTIDKHLTTIESKFKEIIQDNNLLRYNRFVDKILWTGNSN